MELRAYWKIIRRRWWLPAGLMLLTLVFTLAMQRPWQAKPTGYSASMRFNVGIQPERIPGVYTFDRYYTMLTSEYLVDDLGEIVRSQVFAQEVSKRLAEKGITVPAGAIGASTQPGKLHRILTVNVGWPKQEEIGPIAEAIVATLTESSADFFGQFSADEADIRLIDPPAVGAVGRRRASNSICPFASCWRSLLGSRSPSCCTIWMIRCANRPILNEWDWRYSAKCPNGDFLRRKRRRPGR